MKVDGLKIIQCKSSNELMNLWNIWQDKTMFLSTGNCNVPEWNDLIQYGKDHQHEAANFIIEYIKDFESNWCILTFCDECIFCPIVKQNPNDYIPPQSVGHLYTTAMELLISGDSMIKDGKMIIDIKNKN